ncbi:hypothetical protein [Bacillus fungorum]|nr:hypothetical protein [Bacillus fungorum]
MEFKELMKYIEENKEELFDELNKDNQSVISTIDMKTVEEK